ncbi:unnamed protein product, partial [Ectocarpus sp. 12 AP-2014]
HEASLPSRCASTVDVSRCLTAKHDVLGSLRTIAASKRITQASAPAFAHLSLSPPWALVVCAMFSTSPGDRSQNGAKKRTIFFQVLFHHHALHDLCRPLFYLISNIFTFVHSPRVSPHNWYPSWWVHLPRHPIPVQLQQSSATAHHLQTLLLTAPSC